jgi:hypothetical protein
VATSIGTLRIICLRYAVCAGERVDNVGETLAITAEDIFCT